MRWASATVVLALWGALASAAEAEYVVSARSELRVRSGLPGDRNPFFTPELELVPSGEAGLRWKTVRFTLQYNPSLVIRDRADLSPFIFLHRGRASLGFTFERSTLTLTEDLSLGETDIASLRPLDSAQPGSAPGVQSVGAVPYVRSSSTAMYDHRLSDRLGLTVSAGYLVSGSQATDTLPLQWGPTANVRLRWVATREDALTTLAQATASWFATRPQRREGQQQFISLLSEQWDHQFSHTLSGALTGGIAFTRDSVPQAFNDAGDVVDPLPTDPKPGLYREILPVAGAAVSWREESRVQLGASARMAPFGDPFTGLVYERLETRVQGEFHPDRPLAFTVATGYAVAVPVGDTQQAGDRVIYGEATFGWTPKAWFLLGVSARVMWTEQPRLTVPGQLQWATSVWVSVRDHDVTAW